MELLAEPTPFSERKAASDASQWLGADDPPGSKSGACKEEFYRNLGDLVISPMKDKRCGRAFKKWPGLHRRGVHDGAERTRDAIGVRRGDGNGAASEGS
jgi:hypothetical protein